MKQKEKHQVKYTTAFELFEWEIKSRKPDKIAK